MTERPSQGEQIAGIAGLALILTMFLFAWYGFDVPEGVPAPNGLDAFDAYSDWFNIILVFAGFSGIMLALFGNGVARMPVSLSVVATVLGGLSVIVLVIYIISPPGLGNDTLGESIDLSREFGVWLGLIELIALTFGGYMTMQEEGVSFGGAADRLSGPGGGWQDAATQQQPQPQPHHQPPPHPAQQPPAHDPYQQPPPPEQAPPQYQPPPEQPPQDPYQQPPPPPPPPPPAQ